MKVLYIVHVRNMSGSTISFLNMIEGLQEKGIVPVVVYPKKRPGGPIDLKQKLADKGIKGYGIPMRAAIIRTSNIFVEVLQYFAVCLYSIISRYYLSEIVKQERPDIIHTNTGVIHFGNCIARKYNIPHFWHLREYQDLDFHYKILPSKKKFCKLLQTSNVITISEGLLNHFNLQNYNRAKCIYNGIYKKGDANLKLPKEKFFLSASRVSSEKGIKDIIEAFAMIHEQAPEYKLIIAGSGQQNYINDLKEKAKEKCIREQVKFVGHLNNIKELLTSAQALIVASYNEGFGRMTAEASFMGCLIIGRNTAGTKEIMDIVGCSYRFNTTEELSRQMLTITKITNEQYKNIASISQKKAIESFSIENNVDKILKLYDTEKN